MIGSALYRHHDVNDGGFIETQETEAATWNDIGFGIFHTVNEFNGARQIANLHRICYWAVDLDDGTKREQALRLAQSPLRPSWIVETARGYHAYWAAQRASQETWEPIVRDRLVPFFQADSNARDLARVLRTPGYWHLKDPEHPYMVQVVHQSPAAYTENMMLASFRENPGYYEQRRETRKGQLPPPRPRNVISLAKHRREAVRGDDGIWERIYQSDQRVLLEALSGRREIGGDLITFKRNRSGHQILVNGKSSSCWIDERGRIGSSDKGGPSVIEWAAWHGTDKGTILRVLKDLFPELK